MKKYFVIIVWVILFSFRSMAQTAEEMEVAKSVESLRTAMISANMRVLEVITEDALSYGHSDGRVENRQEFIENIVSRKSAYVTIELSEQTISITDDVAVVRHILNADIKDHDKPAKLKLKVMLVFKKEMGGWKLLARQATKLV